MSDDELGEHVHGYTKHGHPIPNAPLYPHLRPPVARCGGPGLCRSCSKQAALMADEGGLMSERLSGPCSKGHHDYCLGARMILPCNCTCHATEHAHPEPEGTSK